ncbi:outer membrane protein assembly factor BamB family protein [Kitasatospora sp. NBC_01266]|uniref:outer membrane protein assembly factor BamB family protein n=1 Tax=Kitasatospora sp. NBC_01266 TaxID=2903572 RepID=UPI002E3315FD|nr:PQQ-binding-like beta-propeller repeat protein [Kitasatospora sp. NBC_01266]
MTTSGSWRFDDEDEGGAGAADGADGSGAAGRGSVGSPEVLADPASQADLDGGPALRTRRTRRQLLLGGAAVLAGGAAWALHRSPAPDRRRLADPQPSTARPAPSGPKPRWTYHGDGPLALDRLDPTPHPPLYLSGTDLIQLDPGTGAERRRFTLPAGGSLRSCGSLLLVGDDPGKEKVRGAITAYDLDSGSTDRQYATPTGAASSRGGSVTVLCCDSGTIYCLADSVVLSGSGGAPAEQDTLLAIAADTRQVRWRVPLAADVFLGQASAVPGGRLLIGRNPGGMAMLDTADGHQLWSVAGPNGWWSVDDQSIYLAGGGSGLSALSVADGTAQWSAGPGAGESWRYLAPLSANGRLYTFADNGVVTAKSAGAALWTYRLPFLLDARSRPLVAGGLLLVPGPLDGGVVALDAATGALRWIFQDGEPGVDVWSATTDGNRLYLGHDRVLHAIDPAGAQT